MPRLEEREYTYFTTVRGMCRTCRRVGPARVFFRDGSVWQQSMCPDCISEATLIAQDKDWYLAETLSPRRDRSPLPNSHSPEHGCPHDCGPCSWHATDCQLPVVSVTNTCDLNCPICFTYNRNDRTYHMPVAELQSIVDDLVKTWAPLDLINITGGEPTCHPDIVLLLEACARPDIGRVTMNSNGLRLAEDASLCRRIADTGAQVILSFNTFDKEASVLLHGRDLVDTKLRAIDNLTAAGVRMTILNVMVRGVNEEAVGGILDMMRSNDLILSMTVQTMTYTGQGGGAIRERRHIPVDEAARIVCQHSRGDLRFSDFVPRPSAHPLCYLTSYVLKQGDTLLPFARFASRERITSLMSDSYLIRLEKEHDFFRDAINDLYARGDTERLASFRALVERLYPRGPAPSVFERQRIAESAVRTVYIHTHMDEDTFDCARAASCPDLVPVEPGRLVPACTYNLFYRMKDERFYDAI